MQNEITDGIRGFEKEYRFLSNFEPCEIEYDGQTYLSSEAAYQAAKTLDKTVRSQFQTLDASASKKLGRKVEMRPDWDQVKDAVMMEILTYKFTQHPTLKEKLLATGDQYLEETNWWGDTYWGVCNGVGRNQLGKTLMQIREKLKLA